MTVKPTISEKASNLSNLFPSPPFVSVIIPVFNDSERLKLCLGALESQSYAKECYEVIVIDNGSEIGISSIEDHFPHAITAYEERPGSYVARNKGISLAKGEVIAFTDSDCIPDSQWIQEGVTALLAEPNIGLVAGRIDLFFKDRQHPTAYELYESIEMGFPQDEFIKEKSFGVTANLFTFRSILDQIGSFDESLKSGGDIQWGQSVCEYGYKLVYSDHALVQHPTRDSWESLRKRSVRIIGGKYDVLKRDLSSWELFLNLLLFLKPPFRSLYQIWTDTRLKSVNQKVKFTVVMLRVRITVIQERLRLQLLSGISERG